MPSSSRLSRHEIQKPLPTQDASHNSQVEIGIRQCEQIQHEVTGQPTCEAEVMRLIGGLHGLAGRFEIARSLFAASNAAFDELGIELDHLLSHPEAIVEMLADNLPSAELQLRGGYDLYTKMGENGLRSTTAALLARVLLAQGRPEEAEKYNEVAEQLAEERAKKGIQYLKQEGRYRID